MKWWAFVATLVFMLVGEHIVTSNKTSAGELEAFIQNGRDGLWAKDPTKTLELSGWQSVRPDSGEFSNITGVVVGNDGSVFVADFDRASVVVFGGDGLSRSIAVGSEQSGRGERPTALGIDNEDRLYVGMVGGGITVLDSDGTQLGELHHELTGGFIRSIVFDSTGMLYVSCFEIMDQFIIHKFGPRFTHLRSFCSSYAVGKKVDTRQETFYAGGKIAIGGDDRIYFTQQAPYELRIYSSAGSLLSTVHRENDYVDEPDDIEALGDAHRFTTFAGSFGLIALNDGRLLNVVIVPGTPTKLGATVLDLFDSGGHLLATREFDGGMNIEAQDANGDLYVVRYGQPAELYRCQFGYDVGDEHSQSDLQ